MVTETIKIINDKGLHARPAGLIVKTASRFKSNVSIKKGGELVNAKSMLSVIALQAGFGSEIEFQVDGEDENDALSALCEVTTTDQFTKE